MQPSHIEQKKVEGAVQRIFRNCDILLRTPNHLFNFPISRPSESILEDRSDWNNTVVGERENSR